MSLAVLLPVIGMLSAPLARALQTDLPVDGVIINLVAMIVPTAASLAVGLAANELIGAIT
jgi:hypothetical protein